MKIYYNIREMNIKKFERLIILVNNPLRNLLELHRGLSHSGKAVLQISRRKYFNDFCLTAKDGTFQPSLKATNLPTTPTTAI